MILGNEQFRCLLKERSNFGRVSENDNNNNNISSTLIKSGVWLGEALVGSHFSIIQAKF